MSGPCSAHEAVCVHCGTPLKVRITEHKYNLAQGLLEKSKLAQHTYEVGNKICWKEANILQIEAICRIIRPVNPAWTSLPSGLPSLQQK
jgi:hypothetical protein